MKIENIEVYGFKAAFRGLRNPMNSWDKSDSLFGHVNSFVYEPRYFYKQRIECLELPCIGPKDLQLAYNLIRGGSEHRKFLRHVQVWFDITIPIYVWSELDTYKVATVRNSCSTMHTLGLRDLTQDDFEQPISNELLEELNGIGESFRDAKFHKDTNMINKIRREYKNLLPSGFLQKATYSMNYETALTMYFQRRNHRLSEWNTNNPNSICSMIISLPLMKEFVEAID